MKDLQELVRPNILALKPYSSARDEYKGIEASVFLDANENPYNNPNNRYPDPLQNELKALIAPIKGVREEQIFLGNGSDEGIDLVYRIFCRPGTDNVVAIDPTYGMYQVCADINDVKYRKVKLDEHFQFRAADLLAAADEQTKLMFLCSPNNPTGNDLSHEEILTLLRQFQGIVIVDEAYAEFSEAPSFLSGRVSQSDRASDFFQSLGMCSNPTGHGLCQPRNHRTDEQDQISLQRQPPYPAGSHPYAVQASASAAMDQIPAGRTYPHDGRIPETALLPDHLPYGCQFLPDAGNGRQCHL